MVPSEAISILYIEDDLGFARLMKKRLERHGFELHLAHNGEEGLTAFNPSLHKAVVVDQILPGLGGLEVIQALAARKPSPPMIMVTASRDPQVAVEAMKLGAFDYIIKDIEGSFFEQMPLVIQRVLERQKLLEGKRQAEEILRQSEERYRSLVELSPDGILVCQDGEIRYMNEALVRMLLAEQAENLLDHKIIEILHPDYRLGFQSRIGERLNLVENVKLNEMKLLRMDGEVFDAEIIAAPVRFLARTALQLIIRDISERKRVENILRENERLQFELTKEKELSELKSSFTSMVSHEFRTPLAVISSSTEILKIYYEKLDFEQSQRHLEKIARQTKRLTHLMNDILLLSRAETLGLEFNPQPLDLLELANSIIEDVQTNFNTDIKLQFTHELIDEQLCLDADLFRHIFQNLLSNALKYSSPEATVIVDLRSSNSSLTLIVRDKGIGMPEDYQKNLFKTFHRANNVGTVQGTGLGLAIVKRAVNQHHGQISCLSLEGEGTTFIVELPYNTSHPTD